MSYVGQRLKRREDPRLLQGQGAYVADVRRPDTLHLAVVRSPHAHARILAIDVAAARASAGVVDVVTFDDVPELARAIPMRLAERGQMRRYLQRPLAHDKVRYVGEPVAVVVAESRYLAEDAAELVAVAYEELEPVTNMDGALALGAPLVDETLPSNLISHQVRMKLEPSDWLGVNLIYYRFLLNNRAQGFGVTPSTVSSRALADEVEPTELRELLYYLVDSVLDRQPCAEEPPVQMVQLGL
jgi:CO/xanthine dehydrogenase Mo-binding subunit